MGIIHLQGLRNFLKENSEKSFSRTYLRDSLKQNFITIQQNLKYLLEEEKSIEIVDPVKGMYQWKRGYDGKKLQKKKSDRT